MSTPTAEAVTRQAAPDDPDEPVVITQRQLTRLRWMVWGLLALVAVLVLGLGLTLPRSIAYTDLVEENLVLRQKIASIDRKMAEVDRLLLRLRLYDAQLKSLAEPDGDHGPLPDDAYANGRLLSAFDQLHGEQPMHDGGVEVAPSDLRPAEAWAEAVQGRVDTFLTMLTRAEPDLTQVVAELEDLRALEEALPSHWPSEGEMTSGFGWRRSPFGRTWKFHSGLDIAARRGIPVYAAGPGRVAKATYNSGYGRMVEIEHGYGITTVYAHCNSLDVVEGDVVTRGQLIGTVGSTGRSTGPHLHFEVRLDGHPVDPLDYLPR